MSEIYDVAFNPIDDDTIAQMIGFEGVVIEETLGLDIYRFILKSIRHEDQQGNLFLKRLLEGPQALWEATQQKIFDLKTLWDITKIDDRWLQYQKQIVGWTPQLNGITDRLTDDRLRRLIASSVALWKDRGNDDSLLDLLTIATGVRMLIWNWFDFRWVLDETYLGEQRQGADSWLYSLPGGDDHAEYWNNLRIVDDGTLDRELVKSIVKLMRPCSERYEISYITFLDQFTADGDYSQWTLWGLDPSAELPIVEGGEIILDDAVAGAQGVVILDIDSQGWNNYTLYARMKMGLDVPVPGAIGFYVQGEPGAFDGYYLALYPQIDMVELGTFGGGPLIQNVVPFPIESEVYYGVRIEVTSALTPGELSITVYVDEVKTIDQHDVPELFSNGSIGIGHPGGQTSMYSEVEVMLLPMDSDTIEINP